MLIKIVLMAALAALIMWQAFRSDTTDTAEQDRFSGAPADYCEDEPETVSLSGQTTQKNGATRKAPRGRVNGVVQAVALEANHQQNKGN